jgi:hypothetical protein
MAAPGYRQIDGAAKAARSRPDMALESRFDRERRPRVLWSTNANLHCDPKDVSVVCAQRSADDGPACRFRPGPFDV